MGHLNRSIDGVFEIVRVVSRSFVSIAEVHAVLARAQQAQREPEVARNRFRLRARHRRHDQCEDDQDPEDDGGLRRHRFYLSSSARGWRFWRYQLAVFENGITL